MNKEDSLRIENHIEHTLSTARKQNCEKAVNTTDGGKWFQIKMSTQDNFKHYQRIVSSRGVI